MSEPTTKPTDEPQAPAEETPGEGAEASGEAADEEEVQGEEAPRDRKYRRELRAAQAEVTRLRGALAELLRERVERVAVERGLRDGSAIWLATDNVLSFTNADLGVDEKKIAEVVKVLVAKAPALRQHVDFDAGARGSGNNTGASWRKLLGGSGGERHDLV